jgi:hypothetical protein
MKFFLKILKSIGLVISLIIIILCVLFFLFSKSMCGTEVIGKYTSDSGKETVTKTLFDCGATTDYTTFLKIGILNHEIMSIKSAHEDDLSVKWIDDKNAIINYTGDPELIYGFKKEISGINFIYKNNDKDLVINCFYNECEKISRAKEIERRKEWCNYSKENREFCNKQENKGWENCIDGSWCHYDGPNK